MHESETSESTQEETGASTQEASHSSESQAKINRYRDVINEIAGLVKAHPDTRAGKLFELSERGENDLDKLDEARALPKLEESLRDELKERVDDVMPYLEASYRQALDVPGSFTAEQEALLKEVSARARALRSAIL